MIHKIIHIDMDAFFVSVEELDNPSLKGKPVVVGHDGPRGVVSTANYVARQYGVHSALPIAVAHRLCPNLVVVEPHFSRYKEVSRQVHAIFHEYTDIIEPLSLDEAYLDVTDNKRGMDMAVDMAREIKQRIKEVTGLTASAGVSYCKFLAKVASDFRKPDGLCTVHPERAIELIDNLKVEQLWGVGEKTAQHMHRLGVYTGKQLRALTLQQLTAQFGKMGRVFYDFARGIDPRPVVTEWVRKSVGCERTYVSDLTRLDDMLAELELLADELESRLARNSFRGRTHMLPPWSKASMSVRAICAVASTKRPQGSSYPIRTPNPEWLSVIARVSSPVVASTSITWWKGLKDPSADTTRPQTTNSV